MEIVDGKLRDGLLLHFCGIEAHYEAPICGIRSTTFGVLLSDLLT